VSLPFQQKKLGTAPLVGNPATDRRTPAPGGAYDWGTFVALVFGARDYSVKSAEFS